MNIIVDTGFLSSLLKIGKAELILEFFGVEHIIVPVQVLEELEKASFFAEVLHLFTYYENKESWVKVVPTKLTSSTALGAGESACIELAKETKSILLIDDKQAFRYAKEQNLHALDLTRFLIACKETGILSNSEILLIIKELKEKDRYLFSKSDQKLLLDG